MNLLLEAGEGLEALGTQEKKRERASSRWTAAVSLAMNDGKYFSFSTTVMNAPCYIPFESMLFSRRVGRASTHGERSSLYTSCLKVAMWWYRNS